MKRFKKVLIIITLLLLVFPSSSFAFSVGAVNDSSGVLNLPPFYYAPKDEVRVNYNGKQVSQLVWDFTEAGTGRQHHKVITAPSGYWYVASGFTCIGTYDTTILDSSGNVLATMVITVQEGDLVSPTCESDGAGDTSDGSDEETPPVNQYECATIICDCIADLKQVNEGINDSVNSNGVTLNEIKESSNLTNVIMEEVNTSIEDNGVKLDDLNSVAGSILGEMKTDDVANVGNMPTVPSIDSDGLEESPIDLPVFEDDTTYFEDQGDATQPDLMPVVPDPAECWDSVGIQCKQDEITPNDELQKDEELQKDTFEKDKELEKNVFEKDKELEKNVFEKDKELEKNIFDKDKEMEKDTFEQTENYGQTNDNLSKNHEYDQTWFFD